jgi:hypothetical protein
LTVFGQARQQNYWEPDVPSEPPGYGNIVALFGSVTFAASWPEIDLTVRDITTDGTAENIKIRVFWGKWAQAGCLPSKV